MEAGMIASMPPRQVDLGANLLFRLQLECWAQSWQRRLCLGALLFVRTRGSYKRVEPMRSV